MSKAQMDYAWEHCPYLSEAVKYGTDELKDLSRGGFLARRRRVMSMAAADEVTSGYR